MRLFALATVLLAIAQGDATTSRASIASDWCRVEFRPDLRRSGLEFLRAAAPARLRISDRLGIDVGGPVRVLVVRSQAEMTAEVLARSGHEPPDWAGGLALPSLSLIVVRSDLPGEEEFDRVDSILTHELVHVALARSVQASGHPIPRWFEEGIAQWMAGRARPLDVPDLRPAATFGWLLDLSNMNAAFAHGEGAAARAYAQAESFVRFVARRGGSLTMRKIVELLTAGVELDAAVGVVTGANLHDTWIAWRIDLASDRTWLIEFVLQAMVALFLLAAVVLGLRRVFRRKHAIESKWAREAPDEPEEEGL